MGRDQRLRRVGIVPKKSSGPAPDPLDYWRERAKYFEQVVVAILVNTPGQQLDLRDANILGYELDAAALEDGGVRLSLVKKVTAQVIGADGEKFNQVPTIGGPCVGGEEGPICHGAEGPHVHPPGFTGHPIREPQADDQNGPPPSYRTPGPTALDKQRLKEAIDLDQKYRDDEEPALEGKDGDDE